jgi:osmotically-inducible protein OsmY
MVTTPEGAPEVVTNPPLDQMVREALEDDKRVNAYLLIISVEDGVACLTGRQDTVDASDAASEVALRIPGIVGVSNDIEIESSV